jgi:hypothetical protein
MEEYQRRQAAFEMTSFLKGYLGFEGVRIIDYNGNIIEGNTFIPKTFFIEARKPPKYISVKFESIKDGFDYVVRVIKFMGKGQMKYEERNGYKDKVFQVLFDLATYHFLESSNKLTYVYNIQERWNSWGFDK